MKRCYLYLLLLITALFFSCNSNYEEETVKRGQTDELLGKYKMVSLTDIHETDYLKLYSDYYDNENHKIMTITHDETTIEGTLYEGFMRVDFPKTVLFSGDTNIYYDTTIACARFIWFKNENKIKIASPDVVIMGSIIDGAPWIYDIEVLPNNQIKVNMGFSRYYPQFDYWRNELIYAIYQKIE